jgi:hypothetical protein
MHGAKLSGTFLKPKNKAKGRKPFCCKMAQNILGVCGDILPATLARKPALALRKWGMLCAACHPWGAAKILHGAPVQAALQPMLRGNRAGTASQKVARFNRLNNF